MNTAPIFYSVSAGLPSSVSDGETFDLANHLIRHPNDTFYVRVTGDSMVDSGVFDGDLLIVDRSAEPRQSDVVVAQVGDGFTVKRFKREKGQLRLVPANPAYSPIEVTEDARICGVATFAIHKL